MPSPSIVSPDSTETPPSATDPADTLVLGLEVWEVGLIATNMAVILVLLLCVCTMTVCVFRRQRHGHRNPASEHFLLKEMEEDDKELVDSPGTQHAYACKCV